MSKETKYKQFATAYQAFLAQEPQKFLTDAASYNEFDGLNVEESRQTLKLVLHVLAGMESPEMNSQLTWNAFNSLVGVMQGIVNSYAQFKSSRDQGSFQGFAGSLDQLAYHLRMFGVIGLANGEARTEQQLVKLSGDLERLETTSREVTSLRDQVKELITPAVAGSLSRAFTDRKNSLFWNRVVWAVALLVTGIASIYETAKFGQVVAAAILDKNAGGAVPLWSAALMRSIFLLPLYATFGFSFAQYRKERDFEEQYAHKAALAISLPVYGDLARGDAVKDQIVTGATSVVFAPPVSQPVTDIGAVKTLGGVKEILEALSSLIPRGR